MVKLLGTLLGKVLAVPVVLFIMGMSYKMNFEDARAARRKKSEPATWDEWAANIYEYVRDAVFLAFRAVSEYSNIITPARSSAIELPDASYTIEDGYVVFHFMARICGAVDPEQLKTDLQRTLRQKHRAHELNGFSCDLTKINGSYYCPLQIWGEPLDYGDYVQVSVVFATEKTIALSGSPPSIHRVLNLDGTGRTRGPRGAHLTDDEL